MKTIGQPHKISEHYVSMWAVPAENAETPEIKESITGEKNISVMTEHRDMNCDPDKKRNISVLWPYRPDYFCLPIALFALVRLSLSR